MSKPVFISYSSAEYNEAKQIAKRIEAAGYGYWMAPESIEGGKSYAQQIPQAIHNAKVILVVLSEKAMASKWVAREVDRAINENKRVMPFLIEDAPMTDEFQFYLTNVQSYRGYLDFDAEFSRMLDDLRSFIGEPENPAAAETAPAEEDPAPVKKTAAELAGKADIVLNKVDLFRLREARQQAGENKAGKAALSAVKILCCVLAGFCILLGLYSLISYGNPGLGVSFLLMGAGILALVFVPKKVTVAGKKISSGTKTLELTDPAMNAADAAKLGRFKALRTLCIKGGAILADDLVPLIGPQLEELRIEGVQLSRSAVRSLEVR